MEIISQQLAIMPYAEEIRKAIKEMEKNTKETEFVIFVSPAICQGGFKLYGQDVIAHPCMEDGKILIVQKRELDICSDLFKMENIIEVIGGVEWKN